MIHVAVISPIQAVRYGLRVMLEDGSSGWIVSEAASLSEIEHWPGNLDVLVVASEPVPAVLLQRLIQQQDGRLAVLLLNDQGQLAQTLSKLAGQAWGVLGLDCSAEELQAAIAALHQGLLVGSPALAAKIFRGLFAAGEPQADAVVDALTHRETEVLQLLALGLANKQIAARLGISEHTVKFHVSAIYTKLGTTNRTEAVRVGVQQGLIAM